MTSEETDIVAKIILVTLVVSGLVLYLLSYDSSLKRYVDEVSARMQEERAEQQAQEVEQRTASLLAAHPTWSRSDCEAVAANKIRLGMTQEMVRASWGLPHRTKRSVSSLGVSEQWVYYSTYYLHFTNGILTSWTEW